MLQSVGSWAAEFREAELPEAVRHHARRAVVDWFAATIPGGEMQPAQILDRALAGQGQSDGPQLIPSGRRRDVRTAALINATAAHTAELDDIFRDGVYHPGAPTIAAALAVAQHLGRTGEEFLRAVIVGFEFGNRVAATVQPAHYRFWHTTGTVGTLGAAAAVATLLRLDPRGFVDAVASATTMAAGLQQAFRSDAMSKPLHAGHAADAGTLAALAAAEGFTGVPDILDGEAGFGMAMSDGPTWDHVFDDLGSRYTITEMTFKNHACCGHSFAAIDGALQLLHEGMIDVQQIREIEVGTYGTALKVVGNAEPQTQFEAQFSLHYCVAAALTLGSVRLAAFTEERLADPEIRALASRVRLRIDDDLDAGFPKQRGARVRITSEGGAHVEALRPTRKGDPDLPLSDDELTDKFSELAVPVLGQSAADTLLENLWSMDEATDLSALVPMLPSES